VIEAAAIDGASPVRGGSGPSSSRSCRPTTFFLLVVNLVYAFFDTFAIIHATTSGRAGGCDFDPRLQGLFHGLRRAGLRVIGRAIGDPDGARSLR
jgi:hypothetical protein